MKTKLLRKLIGIVLVSVLLLTGCTSKKEIGEEAFTIIFNSYSIDRVEEQYYNSTGVRPEITLDGDTVVFTIDATRLCFLSPDKIPERINTIVDYANKFTSEGKELLEEHDNKGHLKAIITLNEKPWIVSEDGEIVD